MKLPRWLVVCILSVSGLSVLVPVGWWWVTWPERTACEYLQSLHEDFQLAEGCRRTLSDLLMGRQLFIVRGEAYWFTAERGDVIERGILYEPLAGRD